MSFSRTLLIFLCCFLFAPVTLADRSCDWHRNNPRSAEHYAAHHDGNDNDGIGCENLPQTHQEPVSVSTNTQTTVSVSANTQTKVAEVTTTTVVSPPTRSQNAASLGQIRIARENRCAPYDRDDYYYPQSIELRIIAENLGGRITSPYTGETFASRSETDIEHIVATSEAHDSGLCATSLALRRQFAQDLLNLTLASPALNRYDKSGKDLAEWLPGLNRCWFVQTVVAVKAKYNLTMDDVEAAVARQVLGACEDTSSDSAPISPNSAGVVQTPPSVPVVELLYNANFRARPGVENSIVGGGRAGSRFPFVTTAGDKEGTHWHQVRLPRGWGWIRADLARLINP